MAEDLPTDSNERMTVAPKSRRRGDTWSKVRSGSADVRDGMTQVDICFGVRIA